METKKLWKYFFVVFLILFFTINWNEISWIFNYRAVSGFFSDFLKSDKKEIQVIGDFDNNDDSEDYKHSQKENSLEIPKIKVTSPLVFVDSLEITEIKKGLELGVVHFSNSVLPGEPGQTIILGHSAPPHWPKIKYYWVFVRINELVEGDKVNVYFNNRKYEYIVNRKFFLERGEEISQELLTTNTNVLFLISCWPPETGARRIAVEARLIK